MLHTDYTQLPSGTWIKNSDGTGPYVRTGDDTFVLLGSGAGGGGDATAANQVTGNASLSAISGKLPSALGSTTSAASLSVTLASDQATVPTRAPAVAITDISGSVTTGGTAQNAAAANANRRGFWLQNTSSGDLWVSTTATAAAASPSLKIVANAIYESPAGGCGLGAISVFGTTTGQTWTAREY